MSYMPLLAIEIARSTDPALVLALNCAAEPLQPVCHVHSCQRNRRTTELQNQPSTKNINDHWH
jgi:hypothetical protein